MPDHTLRASAGTSPALDCSDIAMHIFRGVVGKGKGIGTVFGFPTANIPLSDDGVSGVYAGTVMVAGKEYRAAIYADQRRKLLESHLLDFSGDLYGKEITVVLGEKVREDKEFENEEMLRAQIVEDVARVRSAGTV